jgi:hypothetical protein
MNLVDNFKNLPTQNKVILGIYAGLIGLKLIKGEDDHSLPEQQKISKNPKKSISQRFNEAVVKARETGKTQYIRIDDGGRTKMIKVNPKIL